MSKMRVEILDRMNDLCETLKWFLNILDSVVEPRHIKIISKEGQAQFDDSNNKHNSRDTCLQANS